MTDRFKAQYPRYYGETYSSQNPKFDRCAESVYSRDGIVSFQCQRKNGHGPEGAWCKQHGPIAVMTQLQVDMVAMMSQLEQIASRLERATAALAYMAGDPATDLGEWLEINGATYRKQPDGMGMV
jgi:hypothetical protein